MKWILVPFTVLVLVSCGSAPRRKKIDGGSWEKARAEALRLREAGKLDEALTAARQALSTAQSGFGKKDPRSAASLVDLAEVHKARGEFERAEGYAAMAVDILSQAKDPAAGEAYACLGDLYRIQGRRGLAKEMLNRALTLQEQSLPPNDPKIARTLTYLSFLHAADQKYIESENAMRKVLAIYIAVHGKEHPNVATACNNLGFLAKAQGRYIEARRHYEEAIKIARKAHPDPHPSLALYLHNLAYLLASRALFKPAEDYWIEARRVSEQASGLSDPATIRILQGLQRLYLTTDQKAKAAALQAEIKRRAGPRQR
jgi:tetratricopeptide (TPR) repeat protein